MGSIVLDNCEGVKLPTLRDMFEVGHGAVYFYTTTIRLEKTNAVGKLGKAIWEANCCRAGPLKPKNLKKTIDKDGKCTLIFLNV